MQLISEDPLGIARLFRDGESGLRTFSFPACPPFQLIDTTLSDCERVLERWVRRHWIERIQERGEPFPRLVLLSGRCRVGSTALANAFGRAGVPTYYQPLKSLLRHALVESPPFELALPACAETLCLKETSGPYSLVECLFDPLSILLSAGWPASRLSLVVLERDPLASLNSWLRKWSGRLGEETLLRHFVISSMRRIASERLAFRHGIPARLHRYESTKAPQSITRLLSSLGIDVSCGEDILEGWKAGGAHVGSNTSIVFPPEPSQHHVPDLHSTLAGLSYQHSPLERLREHHRRLIPIYGLDRLYSGDLRRSEIVDGKIAPAGTNDVSLAS